MGLFCTLMDKTLKVLFFFLQLNGIFDLNGTTLLYHDVLTAKLTTNIYDFFTHWPYVTLVLS